MIAAASMRYVTIFITLSVIFVLYELVAVHLATASQSSLVREGLEEQGLLASLISAATENLVVKDRYNNQPSPIIAFEDLELQRVVGSGYVNYGFEATVRQTGQSVMVKIAGDRYRLYSDREIDILETLQRPPRIITIPKMLMHIHSMPNPYSKSNVTYFEDQLNMRPGWVDELVGYQDLGVIVMEMLHNPAKVRTFADGRRALHSLLQTLEFSHKRNIINADMHTGNIFWDGQRAYLFDWNGSFRFEPNKVLIHVEGENKAIIPPEGWHNESSVHQTVTGFDIYSTGVAAEQWLGPVLSGRVHQKVLDEHADEIALAKDFISRCKTADPFQRPNATVLLQHEFFNKV